MLSWAAISSSRVGRTPSGGTSWFPLAHEAQKPFSSKGRSIPFGSFWHPQLQGQVHSGDSELQRDSISLLRQVAILVTHQKAQYPRIVTFFVLV